MKRSRATFDADVEAELRAAAERNRAEAAAALERTRMASELQSLQEALYNNIVLMCGILSRSAEQRQQVSDNSAVNAPPNFFGLMHQQSLGIARLRSQLMGDMDMLYS